MAIAPQPFGVIPESSIASYDFTEFATNLGYVIFYPYTTSGAFLTTQGSIYASSALLDGTAATQTFTTEFKKPANIKGPAVFNLAVGYYNGNAVQASCAIVLYKNSTIIARSADMKLPADDTAGANIKVYVASMNLNIPQTHFKINDTLGIRIECLSIGNGTVYLGADPTNRGWANVGFAAPTFGPDLTRSQALIPFRIDL